MTDLEEYRQMILKFRVKEELRVLLGFAGRNKYGKKKELQLRAFELLRDPSMSILTKIKDLHFCRFPSSAVGASSPATVDATDSRPCGATPGSGLKDPASHSPPSAATRASSPMTGHHGAVDEAGPPALHSGDYSSKMHCVAPPPLPLMGPGGAAGCPGKQSYSVHPDVRFKRLPFYDILAELHPPASLSPKIKAGFQENSFVFRFTPQQVHDIVSSRENLGTETKFTVQVQLRFCLLETGCEQDDNYPPEMIVRVNSNVCPLPNLIPTNKPGLEPKRPSRPINIVSMCRLSSTESNYLSVTWLSKGGQTYALGVYLVRRLTATTLLQRLNSRGLMDLYHTRAMIKEKLQHDPDSEIAMTSLRGSLICPLGKMRMRFPCRALTCPHLQCFDASLYLQMNEKKPTWICPVCGRPAPFSSLVLDGLFTEISVKAPHDCIEVQFHEDGSWAPLVPKNKTSITNSPSSSATASTSRSTAPATSLLKEPPGQPVKKPRLVVIDLTASSSDEDDDGGRSAVPTPGSHLGAPPPLVSGIPSGSHSRRGPPSTPVGGALFPRLQFHPRFHHFFHK
ncbi:LOW QUALITY PROTEIN: E3 SUMO-protein ligase PIAS3-like [Rhipicephalus sanguineus]|uniref:LOW QUALITY PROTEIN: E3 SUMO-protein ligase PIAS3-like n=1 Tax=Rhipicephalus sanguineus TaxID=34632 RepID=UPI00189403A3|nr:LOW QUALITY PROTEIN: E3 SUMO-protein ligase PIAS3-like [Rhipicephalus sanguineus]